MMTATTSETKATLKTKKDAWLDDVHADARLSTAGDKLAVRKDSDNEGEETTDADVANIKRELCAYLEPGETVLDALKRLGGASAGRGNGATKSSTSSRKTESSMDAQSKIAFEKVTELSSALMSSGEYDVYDSRKETFEPSVPAGYAFGRDDETVQVRVQRFVVCP